MRPDDLDAAARWAEVTLSPAIPRNLTAWDAPAGDLDWSCRRTLDHVPDALLFYAAQLATRAERRRPSLRDGAPGADPRQLLGAMVSAAAVLAQVAWAAPPRARAHHPAGLADAEGFVAMGCDEILVHAHDVAAGLGLPARPEPALCRAVLGRLFPWVEIGDDPWSDLLWANGRIPHAGRSRLDPGWGWHCAPLAEWDGTPSRRFPPPT